MKELVVLRGAPASGKTTYARQWVAAGVGTRARVNRDDLRMSVFSQAALLERPLEDAVSVLEKSMAKELLRKGLSVIIDACHIRMSYIREWEKLALRQNAELVVIEDQFREVPIDELVERDLDRKHRKERYVGADVIRSMSARLKNSPRWENGTEVAGWEPYIPMTSKYEPAYIFDLDGTLAKMDGRSPYDYTQVLTDVVNLPVAMMAENLRSGAKIIVCSGRDGSCRPDTEAWLVSRGIHVDALFMRGAGDTRQDAVIKHEIFHRDIAPKYSVLAVFDDRDQVVEMWRAIGLTCLQVAEGDF